MKQKILAIVKDVEAFMETHKVDRNKRTKTKDLDLFISAGRDETGGPLVYHVDGLYETAVKTHGLASLGVDATLGTVSLVTGIITSDEPLAAIGADEDVCLLCSAEENSVDTDSNLDEGITKAQWARLKEKIESLDSGLKGSLDSFRAHTPDGSPNDLYKYLADSTKIKADLKVKP